MANLTTQRNAIKMLYDRVGVILEYLRRVAAGTVVKDQETLRQISALITSLPAVDSTDFREEFMTVRFASCFPPLITWTHSSEHL